MFALILTICFMSATGDVYCKVPAQGLFLNKAACMENQEKALGMVLAKGATLGAKTVQVTCQPFGETPVKS